MRIFDDWNLSLRLVLINNHSMHIVCVTYNFLRNYNVNDIEILFYNINDIENSFFMKAIIERNKDKFCKIIFTSDTKTPKY